MRPDSSSLFGENSTFGKMIGFIINLIETCI